MRILPSLLIALGIAAAPAVWHLMAETYRTEHHRMPAVASDVEDLREQLERLKARLDGLDARTGATPPRQSPLPLPAAAPPETDTLRDSFAQVVLIADRRSVNDGLTHASPSFLQELLGLPRPDLTDDCLPATNPQLTGLLATENVGPVRATLLKPALASLRQVFKNVQVFEPELYDRIKGVQSLCIRLIRGSTSSASAHAYGLAVDINIDGVLDSLADGKTQLGLILMADYFKKEGWIWGAGFSREDSMHFEVSREKLQQWRRQGQL